MVAHNGAAEGAHDAGYGRPAHNANADKRDLHTKVLIVLSRHGIRLPDPDRMSRLISDLCEALGAAAALPTPDIPNDERCANWPACTGAGMRDGAHRLCKACSRNGRSGWTPNHRGRQAREKNPAPGVRVCSMCQERKPLTAFRFKPSEAGGQRPTSRCNDCLNNLARNRYLSARKLQALNVLHLELVADEDIAGLRCLDCGTVIEVGDELVCESGVRHAQCIAQEATA